VLKKTVTYTNFDGDQVVEDLYFHLTQAEIVKLEVSEHGGLSESLKRLGVTQDGKEIMAIFERIVSSAYGIREGGRFKKTDEIRQEFLASEAYSTFFMELIFSTEAQIEFVRGVAPGDVTEDVIRQAGLVTAEKKEEEPTLREVPKPEPRHISRAEFLKAPAEEMEELGRQLGAGEVVIDE
jgi:hypothetical protein